MSAEEHREILLRAIDNFNSPYYRMAYFELFAPDAVLHGLPPNLPPGVAGLKRFYESLWSAFPDAHITLDEIIAERNKIATRYTLRATHRGTLLGILPTGRAVRVAGAALLHMAGGRCVECWQEFSYLSILRQLKLPLLH